MLFNSFSFALFFPVVTAGYFLLPHRARWAWLLAASAFFYAFFIPLYLLILALTIAIDYSAGLAIARTEGRTRRAWLLASIAANVGVLAFFKYAGFIDANLAALARVLDWNYSAHALAIALPIGLSFHTFQAMSYTIEVYRGRVPPERHLGVYALYVMFYPQLVAGPIERPQHLLPQLHAQHRFEYGAAVEGLQLMVWGLFKKVVVADRLALVVNRVYGDPHAYPVEALALATVFFAYQIFCDFSGYSDIARGAARVMGFDLAINFERPYRATSISEFWRRWHVSLSTWFRDYVYVPLGGNRVPTVRRCVNLMVTFVLSGLWHGASWTFVLWGVLHGFYASAAVLAGRRRPSSTTPGLFELMVRRVWIFALVCIGWVFFRAATFDDALYITRELATMAPTMRPDPRVLATVLGVSTAHLALCAILIVAIEGVHALQEHYGSIRARLRELPVAVRWPAYYGAIASILVLGVFDDSRFIYFQF